MLKTLQANKTQLIKFGLAGASGAAVEFCLFYWFSHVFPFFKGEYGYLLANLVAIVFATIINYIISVKWVFEGGKYSRRKEFAMFMLISLLSLVLNQGLMYVFVSMLALNVMLSKAAAIGLVAIINYISKKYLVFNG